MRRNDDKQQVPLVKKKSLQKIRLLPVSFKNLNLSFG